jgi:hypothetical protein
VGLNTQNKALKGTLGKHANLLPTRALIKLKQVILYVHFFISNIYAVKSVTEDKDGGRHSDIL